MVVRKTVGCGEVFPAKARHVRRRRKQRERDQRNQQRKPKTPFHRVLKYSMRSFSSSFCKSLVTPCVSCGLKIVQISSIDFADPSCRYGAEYATFVRCGTSISGERSVHLPLPTSASFVLVYFGPLWQ